MLLKAMYLSVAFFYGVAAIKGHLEHVHVVYISACVTVVITSLSDCFGISWSDVND